MTCASAIGAGGHRLLLHRVAAHLGSQVVDTVLLPRDLDAEHRDRNDCRGGQGNGDSSVGTPVAALGRGAAPSPTGGSERTVVAGGASSELSIVLHNDAGARSSDGGSSATASRNDDTSARAASSRLR